MEFNDCNLHLDLFESPISKVKEYRFFNIKKYISLCSHISSFEFLLNLKTFEENLLLGIGLHPNISYNNREIDDILNYIETKSEIIGECGLDYEKMIKSSNEQIQILEKQFKIAEKYNKVLILHIRKAERSILDIIDSYYLEKIIIHWYSGALSDLKKLISHNCYFSYNNCILLSKKYENYIKEIPLSNLLLESDAPFKYKGKPTLPEDFSMLIEKIAKIKSLDNNFTADLLKENFDKLIMS